MKFNTHIAIFILGASVGLLSGKVRASRELIPFHVIDIDHGNAIIQPYVSPLVSFKVISGAVSSSAVLNCRQEYVSHLSEHFVQLECGNVRLEMLDWKC